MLKFSHDVFREIICSKRWVHLWPLCRTTCCIVEMSCFKLPKCTSWKRNPSVSDCARRRYQNGNDDDGKYYSEDDDGAFCDAPSSGNLPRSVSISSSSANFVRPARVTSRGSGVSPYEADSKNGVFWFQAWAFWCPQRASDEGGIIHCFLNYLKENINPELKLDLFLAFRSSA
jgi:hypothetical protein